MFENHFLRQETEDMNIKANFSFEKRNYFKMEADQ